MVQHLTQAKLMLSEAKTASKKLCNVFGEVGVPKRNEKSVPHSFNVILSKPAQTVTQELTYFHFHLDC